MSSILGKLLCLLAPRRREYLAVDKQFNILETSMGVQRFADSPEEIGIGKDVRLGFPELFGLEEILISVLEEQQSNYELKAIGRSTANGNSLYFDLYAIPNPDKKCPESSLILFLEDVTERMLLEQSLVQAANEKSLLLSQLENAKKYVDTIITSMADALIVATRTGTIKTVNQASQDLFGYREDELIGKSISLIITDRTFLRQASQHHRLFNKSLKNVEVICQKKSGEKITVAFSCSTIQIDTDSLQDLIYIGRDITEYQQIQRRQAVQYTTTRILSESATIEQATKKILPAICERLGWDIGEIWTPDSYLGLSVAQEHSPPSVLRCVETWVRPSVAIPMFMSVTCPISAEAGAGLPGHVWATASPHWISDILRDEHFLDFEPIALAGLHGAFGVPIRGDSELLGVMTFYSREVHQVDAVLLQTMAAIGSQLGQFVKRKQAETALFESEQRYRDLFENASDLIQSITPDGRFLYVNRAWRETLGYDNEGEIAKLSIFDILHPDCQESCWDSFLRVFSGEKIDRVKVEFITKNGKKIWLEGSVNCKYVQGKPVATRGIFRDITERLQAEAALRYQQEQTERLLLNILPSAIADRLKQETSTIAENFAEVSVMFADIVGFTEMASSLSAIELVNLLNQIFSDFDRLTEKHGLEKIKTVGDAYMVVGGLPMRRPDHAEAIAEMALDMKSAIAHFRDKTGKGVNIRIGINTGAVVAGVIGIKKFSYDLWGDTVNIASRMETHGLPGQIQVTAATYERLRQQYVLKERGSIQVKGKGEMMTYLLMGRKE
ncbi:MAG TPA: adenylate/guanylate cyclase domain-containing protein [Allocoleopsis sp.]